MRSRTELCPRRLTTRSLLLALIVLAAVGIPANSQVHESPPYAVKPPQNGNIIKMNLP